MATVMRAEQSSWSPQSPDRKCAHPTEGQLSCHSSRSRSRARLPKAGGRGRASSPSSLPTVDMAHGLPPSEEQALACFRTPNISVHTFSLDYVTILNLEKRRGCSLCIQFTWMPSVSSPLNIASVRNTDIHLKQSMGDGFAAAYMFPVSLTRYM